MGTRIWSCILLVLSATTTAWTQTTGPLPDQIEFLQQLRSNLESDRLLQSRYTFREKRTDVRRDDRGAEVGRSEKVFDVDPALKGTEAYRRVILVDGVPPDAASLADAERLRRSAVADRVRQIQRETSAQRLTRLRDEAEERQKENAVIDDAFRLYRFEMLGRETLDGHDAIAFTFAPAPGAVPRTGEGKLFQKFTGRAWVDERDHQLMRLEVASVDEVTFGFGFLARIQKGSKMVFERRPINDIWLPSELRYSGDGRVLLLKKLRVDVIREYSDYAPFRMEAVAPGGTAATRTPAR